MTDIINLTPHDVVIADGTVFKASGTVARVVDEQVEVGAINGIPVYEQRLIEVSGLPDPQPNTVYIVSSIVLSFAKSMGRTDVVAPNTSKAIRDDKGFIVAVHGFVK